MRWTRRTEGRGISSTAREREVDEGNLPSCQVALARHGELEVFETLGDATDDSRYVVFSCTKAFVAGAMWALIGDGAVDVAQAGRRLHPRVRAERQGRDHGRAGDAAHLGLPARAARPTRVVHARRRASKRSPGGG